MNILWSEPYWGRNTIIHRCVECDCVVTDQHYFYNWGICPTCHHFGGSTIVRAYHDVVQFQYKRFVHIIPIRTEYFRVITSGKNAS